MKEPKKYCDVCGAKYRAKECPICRILNKLMEIEQKVERLLGKDVPFSPFAPNPGTPDPWKANPPITIMYGVRPSGTGIYTKKFDTTTSETTTGITEKKDNA